VISPRVGTVSIFASFWKRTSCHPSPYSPGTRYGEFTIHSKILDADRGGGYKCTILVYVNDSKYGSYMDMLTGVISSRTKVQILVKLFLNPGFARICGVSPTSSTYPLTRSARNRHPEPPQGARIRAGRPQRSISCEHKPSPVPRTFLHGAEDHRIDELVRSVVDRLGNLEVAYLVGDYARGADNGIIDVVLIGDIDRGQLDDFVAKTEEYIGRKIRTLVITKEEFQRLQGTKGFKPILKLWEAGSSMLGVDKFADRRSNLQGVYSRWRI